ncbi:MAG: histidine kinase [Bacteroidia bacterium]|nr:histidine kinase [Bacteroidia bacterium]
MRKVTTLFIFLCSFNLTFAQDYTISNPESLEQLLLITKGSEKADLFSRLSLHYIHSNPEKGKKYADQAMEFAEEHKNIHAQGLANLCLGISVYQQGNIAKALDFFLTAEKELEATEDYRMLGHARMELTYLYLFTGNYDEFFRWGMSLIEPYTRANDMEALALTYYGMGFYHNNYSGDYDASIKILKKADSIAVAATIRPAIRGGILTSLGFAFTHKGNFDSTMFYNQLALQQYDESRDTGYIFKTNTLLDMGTIANIFGVSNLALQYSHQAFDRSQRYSYLYGIARSSNNISIVYEQFGNMNESVRWRETALIYFQKMDSVGNFYLDETNWVLPGYWWGIVRKLNPEEVRYTARSWIYSTLRWFSNYYESRGVFQKALRYERQAISVKDSLVRYKRAKEFLGLQIQYETEKKEQQIELLFQENQLNQLQLRRTTWFIAGLAIVVILVILFAVIWIRQNRLRESQHALELEQRLLRTQMNPHFIFNSLASIQNFIVTQEPMKASTYLSRFSNLVRNILYNSVEEYVTFEDEISTIENYLELQKVRYQGKFDFTIEVDPAIDVESMMIPPMLAQPFIENSIEHGFRQKETKGHLKIRFMKNGENLILFEVEDDGIGRDRARQLIQNSDPRHRSMATSITRDRLTVLNRKLKHKIRLEILDLKDEAGNASGTKVRFVIPVKS